MKRLTLAACAGILAAAMAAPALAADMPVPYKAPVMAAPWNWTGFYVGINGGYGLGSSNWTAGAVTTGDFNTNGAMVGATVGYNMQMNQIVFGFEGDASANWMTGTDSTGCCQTQNDWLGTARVRLGYAMDRVLPYITAGGAFGDVKASTLGLTQTATRFGWTAGAGVEVAFGGAWSAKVEYLYADLGSTSCDAITCGVVTDVDFRANIARAGINYHF